MADVGSHHFVKSSGKAHRVLVPQPSENEHDPLNWSLTWKLSAIVAASVATFMQGFGPLSLAPMFGDYIEAFDCSLADAVQFTGVAILVLGFSNFIWYVAFRNEGSLNHRSRESAGSLSVPHSVAAPSTLPLSLFASDLPSGAPKPRPTGASWERVCKWPQPGK